MKIKKNTAEHTLKPNLQDVSKYAECIIDPKIYIRLKHPRTKGARILDRKQKKLNSSGTGPTISTENSCVESFGDLNKTPSISEKIHEHTVFENKTVEEVDSCADETEHVVEEVREEHGNVTTEGEDISIDRDYITNKGDNILPVPTSDTAVTCASKGSFSSHYCSASEAHEDVEEVLDVEYNEQERIAEIGLTEEKCTINDNEEDNGKDNFSLVHDNADNTVIIISSDDDDDDMEEDESRSIDDLFQYEDYRDAFKETLPLSPSAEKQSEADKSVQEEFDLDKELNALYNKTFKKPECIILSDDDFEAKTPSQPQCAYNEATKEVPEDNIGYITCTTVDEDIPQNDNNYQRATEEESDKLMYIFHLSPSPKITRKRRQRR